MSNFFIIMSMIDNNSILKGYELGVKALKEKYVESMIANWMVIK